MFVWPFVVAVSSAKWWTEMNGVACCRRIGRVPLTATSAVEAALLYLQKFSGFAVEPQSAIGVAFMAESRSRIECATVIANITTPDHLKLRTTS